MMRAPVAHRNRHANELLDIADERHFVAIAQRNRDTIRACARRSADAMYVSFRQVRYIEVHDVTDPINIDSAGGDIGGNKRHHLAFAEGCKHALALALRFIAVNCLGGDAGPVQSASNLIGAVFGPRENQRPVNRLLPQYVDEDGGLCRAIDADNALLNALGPWMPPELPRPSRAHATSAQRGRRWREAW